MVFKLIKKGIKKITKPFRKIVKGIAKGVRKVGRFLKKGLGKVAKAFGKLGPLGSIALSFMLPGIGSALSSWYGGLGSGNIIKIIGDGIVGAAQAVKGGVGRVFSSITIGIEYGMNAVSKPFMQKGARGAGSAFRDFVSNATGGAINPSELTKPQDKITEFVVDSKGGMTELSNITDDVISPSEIIKPKSKTTEFVVDSKGGMTDITKKIPVPGATPPTIPPVDNRRIMAKLNDPDVGLYDAITGASPERSYYTKITALQAYDYATNPLNLSEDEMNEHRRSRAAYQSDAMGLLQENQAKNLNTLYDLGNQVVSTAASTPANSSVYDYWLNQIYGNSMQGMSSQAAINAPVYGMQFEDYLTA